MVMGNLPMIIMQKKSDSFTNKAESPADVSKAGMRRIGLFHRVKQSVSLGESTYKKCLREE